MAAGEIPVSEPVRALDLLASKPAAVVSRTLFKRASGTVTLFAFDERQGLGEHTASNDALLHVLEGEADVTVDGAMHTLSAGGMILLPAHHPHAVTARTPLKMLLTMIRSS